MEVNERQLDALNELGNIGASHAANSLSQMLESPVEITVPEVRLIDIARLSDHITEDIAAFIIFEVQGEVNPGGFICLYMPKISAIRLTNTMLGLTDTKRDFTEMDESALLEVGNIMVSQFLDATATLLNIVMIPSPPDLIIDMAHAIVESIIACVAEDIDQIILFRTELQCREHEIQSSILLMPDYSTLCEIFELLDKAVKGV